jgi:hypothetical protein
MLIAIDIGLVDLPAAEAARDQSIQSPVLRLNAVGPPGGDLVKRDIVSLVLKTTIVILTGSEFTSTGDVLRDRYRRLIVLQ